MKNHDQVGKGYPFLELTTSRLGKGAFSSLPEVNSTSTWILPK